MDGVDRRGISACRNRRRASERESITFNDVARDIAGEAGGGDRGGQSDRAGGSATKDGCVAISSEAAEIGVGGVPVAGGGTVIPGGIGGI